MAATTAGLIAILTNTIWGTDYPNFDSTSSKPVASATKYLAARPFDALALVNYSQSAENQAYSRLDDREHMMMLASQLAPNDVEVVKALAGIAFQRSDTLAGLNQVARWASLSPADRPAATNILLTAASSPEWEHFISEQLKAHWPLADALLLAACGRLGGNQLLALGSAMSGSVSLRSETAACVSRKLIAENRSPDARAFWLGTLRPLPAQIGYVFNGDFSLPIGNSPFNWALADGGEFRDGFRVGIVNGAAPDGKARALLARFNGRRVSSPLATQTLALPPGSYRLRYNSKQSGFAGSESARWMIRCIATEAVVEQLPGPKKALTDGWSAIVGTFTISDRCIGQTIRLELSSRLQALTGTNASAAFANVEIERIDT